MLHSEGGGKRVGGGGVGGADLSLLEELFEGATAADNLNKKLTQQLEDEREKAEEATSKVSVTMSVVGQVVSSRPIVSTLLGCRQTWCVRRRLIVYAGHSVSIRPITTSRCSANRLIPYHAMVVSFPLSQLSLT